MKKKKEIEIKIQLKKGENIVKRLKELGAKREKPYSQTTYGFFSNDSMKKGIFPRLRLEKGLTPVLTVKVKGSKKTKYFERDEYSLKINDLKTGIKIMNLLGYNKMRKFTKVREHWNFSDRPIELAIDKLYFGRFLEIEGPKKEIEKIIKELRLENKNRITKAYLALEDDYLSKKIKSRRRKIKNK